MLSFPRRPRIGPALAALSLSLVFPLFAPVAHAQVSVLTQNGDNARTGANTIETALTPANVNITEFGKLFTIKGLDANVNGQALYVPNVTINGTAHNVLVAYQSDNRDNSPCGLAAFDADTGAQLWRDSSSDANPIFPASATYTTPTPVIDAQAGVVYVLSKTGSDDTGKTYLHAIDLTTGKEKTGSPVQIQATVKGTGDGSVNGLISFDGPISPTSNTRFHANDRAGLLLLNGVVYPTFAHNSDSYPYHGWMFGYGYDGTKFTQKYVFCTNPDGGDAGIWMAGKGPAVDSQGNIYVSVGNGTFSANSAAAPNTDYGMCYLKLSPSLQVLDWFAPYDENGNSNADLDTGNSGVVGIPGTTKLFGGATKFGTGFLLDSANLGHFNPTPSAGFDGVGNVTQRLDGLTGNDSVGQNPIAWDAGTYKYVYLWANGSHVDQLRYDPSSGLISVYKQAAPTDGGSLAVTSNGTANAILWAAGGNGVLHAFDATDVSKPELWDSAQAANSRDALSSVGHFQFPTVANGRVYVPTGAHSIVVYGLLPRTVSGVVSLQGVKSGSLGQPITFTFTPTGSTTASVTPQTVTLNATDGSFTLAGVPPGTYTMGVKGSKWLRRNVTLDTTAGSVANVSVTLLGGDATGDNKVNGQDFLVLHDAYLSAAGDGTGRYRAAADFNCDGKVNAQDFLILHDNYLKSGD